MKVRFLIQRQAILHSVEHQHHLSLYKQAKLDQLLARQQGEAVRGILEKRAKVVAERDELAIANKSAKIDKKISA